MMTSVEDVTKVIFFKVIQGFNLMMVLIIIIIIVMLFSGISAASFWWWCLWWQDCVEMCFRNELFRDKRGLLLNRGCTVGYCSWRVVALSLTILILLLTSVIVYFGAVKYPQVIILVQIILVANYVPEFTIPPPLCPDPAGVLHQHDWQYTMCIFSERYDTDQRPRAFWF